MHAPRLWLAFGIWYANWLHAVSSMLQRKQLHRIPIMISLVLTVVAAGAANIALVAFLADRLGPKAGASVAAGEFIAVTEAASASTQRKAVKVSNENASVGAAKLAA